MKGDIAEVIEMPSRWPNNERAQIDRLSFVGSGSKLRWVMRWVHYWPSERSKVEEEGINYKR